jgi:hypothetical protein
MDVFYQCPNIIPIFFIKRNLPKKTISTNVPIILLYAIKNIVNDKVTVYLIYFNLITKR